MKHYDLCDLVSPDLEGLLVATAPGEDYEVLQFPIREEAEDGTEE